MAEIDSRFNEIHSKVNNVEKELKKFFIKIDKLVINVVDKVNSLSSQAIRANRNVDSLKNDITQLEVIVGEIKGRHHEEVEQLEGKVWKAFHNFKKEMNDKLFELRVLFEKIEKVMGNYIKKTDEKTIEIQKVNATCLQLDARIKELERMKK